MVVLDVGLEMLGKAVDALREDRHLYLWRSGIAGLYRVALDHFGLAAGRYRHRVSLSCRGCGRRPGRDVVQRGHHNYLRGPTPAQAGQYRKTRPGASGNCDGSSLAGTIRSRRQSFIHTPSELLRRGRLKMRRGRNSPFSTSASAISAPWEETDTQPARTGASRPRSSTAWPRVSRAASPGLTRSVGKAATPASTGRRAAPSSVAASLEEGRCNRSRLMARSSPKGPTSVRRSAATCPRQPAARPRSRASART